MTQFYDLEGESLCGPLWPNGYIVDGVPGIPPTGKIEVIIVHDPAPTLTSTQKAIPRNGINAGKTAYIYGWDIADKTPSELRAEVPDICNAQLKLWLHNAGKRMDAIGFVNSEPNTDTRLVMQTEWQSRGTFTRTNQLVLFLQEKMAWTDSQVDALFKEASQL